MMIECTQTRLTPRAAVEFCSTENNGLLGKVADKLRGGPQKIDVLKCRLFYNPYYCVSAKMHLPLLGNPKGRQLFDRMVVEGGFGIVQQLQGLPETQKTEVKRYEIVAANYSKAQACDRVQEFLRKQCFRKYHMYPEFEFPSVNLVYKPLYAVLCQKGKRRYYQIVDAEVGVKDYVLDIRFPQMKFLDATAPEA